LEEDNFIEISEARQRLVVRVNRWFRRRVVSARFIIAIRLDYYVIVESNVELAVRFDFDNLQVARDGVQRIFRGRLLAICWRS
jgi:hypothetical protein